jgi:mono/diheme cytochrome c family protein
MAIIKRLLILSVVLASPLALGLLFTYDIIKIEWISFMEIQPSFKPQEDPLPLPARSIPIQGAPYAPGLAAPVNPVRADEASIKRGEILYNDHCALCHGVTGEGNGTFAAFLVQRRPTSLVEGNVLEFSDGYLFNTISNGVIGAMPALRENLPIQQRWDVVNYLRVLQKQKK